MRWTIKVDSAEAQAYLQKFAPIVLQATESGFRDFMNRTANVVREKLSGPVLRVRTGRLRQSIHTTVEKMAGGFLGKIGTNVKYAGIHEFGGTIIVPTIYPVKKKALRFFIGGQEIFAKKVKAHAIKMPERSYLRSSLQEMTPFAPKIILDYIQEALSNA